MPDVKVEIAFNAGFGTAAASRTWTDVSAYVELDQGLSITFGRQDERSTADANQLTLTFDNRDGRFTPGNTGSPYYPNVKLDRPIRVTATPVDGSASTRFVGYINEWPLEWPDAADASAYVTVTASSRLARLGTTASLANIVSQSYLVDDPAGYYTLGEPEASTQANDSSGNAAGPLVPIGTGTAVVFGNDTGPGTDGITAAQFAQGQYLGGPVLSGTGAISIEAFFLTSTTPPAGPNPIASFVSCGDIVLGITPTGTVLASAVGVDAESASSYADGATHHAAATWDGTTIRLYVDGALADTAALAGTPDLGDFSVGGGSAAGSALPFTGVIAHAAAYSSALSAARVADHASAGLTGFVGDTTDARLVRYAAFAGIASAEVVAEAGQTSMAHIDTTDAQVVEMMRKVETTEGGVLFDDRDGTLAFHNRAHRYVVSSAFTLNMASHMVEADYRPILDRTYILNDVTASNADNSVTAHKVDATSRDDYGLVTASLEIDSTDSDAPLNAAAWTVYKYKDPRERTPTLAVQALAQVGKTPNCATVMAATVGTKITVSNRPTQAASSTVTYFVEGYTEVYGPESLLLTFNVTPTSPEDQVLVIGDATRGVIGTNPVAY